MTERKKQAIRKPEKSIRHGGVTADIYRRESADGFPYYSFTVSRTWKRNGSDRDLNSPYFFEHSVSDLSQAAEKATRWIEKQRAEAGALRAARVLQSAA